MAIEKVREKAATGTTMSNAQESMPGEEPIVARFEPHWFARVPLVLWILLGFASLGFTWWLALYEYLRLKFLEQGVTRRSVLLKKGILHRTTTEMDLDSIEAVDVVQGALGRSLGFGTIRVTGRGGDHLVFRDIEDPVSVKRRLEGLRGSTG